jgi:hypothetical protein
MRHPTVLAAAAVLALAAGGAAPAADAPKEAAPAAKLQSQCFHTSMIQGFAAPDEDNLYIRVGRDVWHFTMFTHCLDLDWNQRIALRSRGGSNFICNALDVDIVNRAAGLGAQRCFVSSMEKLTPAQVAALPKHAKP